MAPVIEIATFQASAALRADPTLLIPALDTISRANGFLNAYHGFQVDGTVVFLVIAWKNFAARNAFKASYEHSKIIEQLEPARTGPIDTLHVDVHGDHALSALENSPTQVETFTSQIQGGCHRRFHTGGTGRNSPSIDVREDGGYTQSMLYCGRIPCRQAGQT
ncbi:hypothetical protein FA13DRAFT_1808216 [Coprinellus micaceus]|uniref:ABM domain-containing protein n=1 Tax=Coprinellus micaceus TaxID=71717 RepID=A0A4Y7U1G5_COPMI|nr:hypothetical protein FA13DRAFT_1808216 [Coprinellus micaceus]